MTTTAGNWPVWQNVKESEFIEGPDGGRLVRLHLSCGHTEERRVQNGRRIPGRVHCEGCKAELLKDLVEDTRPG